MPSLPEYELTRHARAKRIRLSVNALGKIKVTAPRHVSKLIVDEFLLDNVDWINTAIATQRDPRVNHPNLGFQIPQQIHLKSIDSNLTCSANLADKARFSEKNSMLYLYGKDDQEHLNQLRLWLRNKAKNILPQRLDFHAHQLGLSYNRVVIKNQKSRWGSCSSKKNINLNQSLLFLTPALVDYLLIHELTHLKHPNHSPSYWRAVAQADPNYREHDKQLNVAVKHLPLWALPG